MGNGFDKAGPQTPSGRGPNAAPYLDDTVRDAMRLRAVNDRLKIEHSIIDGLRPVLETLLADNEAIASIVPGVIRKVRKARGPVKIGVTVPTQNGWKGIALSAGARQELFISTKLSKEDLEAAIARALSD
jgi:hypothetical protein